MGRPWTVREFLNAENLWCFIDEQSTALDTLGQHDSIESSELCKLVLLGRREMLDRIATYLSENQTALRDIVLSYGILEEEQIVE